jgi:hypothetical protein
MEFEVEVKIEVEAGGMADDTIAGDEVEVEARVMAATIAGGSGGSTTPDMMSLSIWSSTRGGGRGGAHLDVDRRIHALGQCCAHYDVVWGDGGRL